MLLCFNTISAENLLHVLYLYFLAVYPILAHFHQKPVAVKSIKNYLRKRCSALATIMLMKFRVGLLFAGKTLPILEESTYQVTWVSSFLC
jgi:hypothetical protein